MYISLQKIFENDRARVSSTLELIRRVAFEIYHLPINIPGHINRAKALLDNINLHTRDLITNQERVMTSYSVTMTDLEEYRRNRPVVETLKAKDEALPPSPLNPRFKSPNLI